MAATAKQKAIIILVHGTWARGAPWTKPDYKFAQNIASELGDAFELVFDRIDWTGRLNHRARIQAADDLANLIRSHRAKSPGAHIYVVGHSHGGNIAIYAYNSLGRNELSGIICLSTPFIVWRPYKLDKSTQFIFMVVGISVTLVVSVFAMVFVNVKLSGMANPDVVRWISVLLPVMAVSIASKLFLGNNQTQELAAKYNPIQGVPEEHIFIAGSSWDEAAISLMTVDAVIGLPSYLKKSTMKVAVAFWITVAGSTLVLDIIHQRFDGEVFLRWAAWDVTLYLVVFMLMVRPILIFLATVISAFAKGLLMGYGQKFDTYLNYDIRICRTPSHLKSWRVYLPQGRGLAHSRLYQDSQVCIDIARWIRERYRL